MRNFLFSDTQITAISSTESTWNRGKKFYVLFSNSKNENIVANLHCLKPTDLTDAIIDAWVELIIEAWG